MQLDIGAGAGKVEDVMTVDPLTIAEDESIYSLVDLFLSHHFHGVPVVNSEGRLIGIARDSEILACLSPKSLSW